MAGLLTRHDGRALRQSPTERKVLAWSLGELDHEVVRRYSGTSDDPRVQLLEQGEAGFFWPAGDEREFKHNEVVGVFHPEKRRRVQEAVARKLMDDLEEVIRGNLQDADQRILDRLGHVGEATLVVSPCEDMNFYDWHLKVSLSWIRLGTRIEPRSREGPQHRVVFPLGNCS